MMTHHGMLNLKSIVISQHDTEEEEEKGERCFQLEGRRCLLFNQQMARRASFV